MPRSNTPFWLLTFMLVAVSLLPREALAKGGIFSSPIFSIVFTVAVAALTWGVGSPLLLAGQALQSATITAIAQSTVFQAVSLGLGALSLATASHCLAGSNNFQYDNCDDGDGGGGGNQQPQQVTIKATNATPAGPNYTCDPGYHIENVDTCVQDGYVSCALAGHPDLVCPNNTSCTTDGQCSGQSGSNCNANTGSACTSAPNSCGMTGQGAYQCSGACPAVAPADADCAPPEISISAAPALVNPGNSCTVSWDVTNATECSLSSNWSGDAGLPQEGTIPSGSYVSGPLNVGPTYTLSCMNGMVVSASASITCHLNPAFNEN